ncbi:MAG: CinA family protein [Alphaproteobacteria bacterium]|nr:CinA family protein [Alphaproteobacteria bacterium]
MKDLGSLAEAVAKRLIERGETIAVSESSAGGLISAALLGVPGASAYFLGGAVVYTEAARSGLLQIGEADMAGIRAASEPYACLNAGRVRDRLGADWGLAETGATGPTGNRYGDAAGHACFAIVGKAEVATTLETGSDDRAGNMRSFARAALELMLETLEAASREA